MGSGEVFGAISHAAVESSSFVNVIETEGGGVEAAVPFSVVAGAVAVLLEGIG